MIGILSTCLRSHNPIPPTHLVNLLSCNHQILLHLLSRRMLMTSLSLVKIYPSQDTEQKPHGCLLHLLFLVHRMPTSNALCPSFHSTFHPLLIHSHLSPLLSFLLLLLLPLLLKLLKIESLQHQNLSTSLPQRLRHMMLRSVFLPYPTYLSSLRLFSLLIPPELLQAFESSRRLQTTHQQTHNHL